MKYTKNEKQTNIANGVTEFALWSLIATLTLAATAFAVSLVELKYGSAMLSLRLVGAGERAIVIGLMVTVITDIVIRRSDT